MAFKYNPETTIIKSNLTKSLTDAANIEFVTYLTPLEIERFSILGAIVENENKLRKLEGIEEESILDDVLFNIKLNRASVNGLRSEQLVKVLNSHLNADQQKQQINNTGGGTNAT